MSDKHKGTPAGKDENGNVVELPAGICPFQSRPVAIPEGRINGMHLAVKTVQVPCSMAHCQLWDESMERCSIKLVFQSL